MASILTSAEKKHISEVTKKLNNNEYSNSQDDCPDSLGEQLYYAMCELVKRVTGKEENSDSTRSGVDLHDIPEAMEMQKEMNKGKELK